MNTTRSRLCIQCFASSALHPRPSSLGPALGGRGRPHWQDWLFHRPVRTPDRHVLFGERPQRCRHPLCRHPLLGYKRWAGHESTQRSRYSGAGTEGSSDTGQKHCTPDHELAVRVEETAAGRGRDVGPLLRRDDGVEQDRTQDLQRFGKGFANPDWAQRASIGDGRQACRSAAVALPRSGPCSARRPLRTWSRCSLGCTCHSPDHQLSNAARKQLIVRSVRHRCRRARSTPRQGQE